MQTSDASAYVDFACRCRSSAGDIEIDTNATVNPSADDGQRVQGVYVQAWVYVSNEQLAGSMAQRLADADVQAEDLDDLVHTIAERGLAADTDSAEADLNALSTQASDANNEGLEGQCLFLIEHLGAGAATAEVNRLIAEHPVSHIRPQQSP
mgnify:CR=1 FL=1